VSLMSDEETRVRTVAGATLKRIGPDCIPYLIEGMSDPDAILRERAAILLGQLGATDDTAIEALLEALSDFDEDVRAAARRSLEVIEAAEPVRATAGR
jgi:HEAT repeat protein